MSLRFSPCFELKLSGPALATGEFSGYASTFNDTPDSYGDVIAPGAFSKSLADYAARRSAPAMLFCHNPEEPCGTWLEMKEDRAGLQVHGRFTLATQRGREGHALAKDGALALSIGFNDAQRQTINNGRLIKSLNLMEVSPVPRALAANQSAQILQVKSIGQRPNDIRAFEDALHHTLGFSIREAKRIARASWSALSDAEDEAERSAELKSIAQLFKSGAAQFIKR